MTQREMTQSDAASSTPPGERAPHTRVRRSRRPPALTHVPMSTAELPTLDPHRPAWPGDVRTVGDVRLHVRVTPGNDGATAVYVHGLGGSASNWTDLAAALAPRANGLAVDLPGFGLSEPAEGFGYSLAEHTAALETFLDGLDDPAVHLFGNSMGGAISVLLAAKRPDLVRTLTLISPAVPDLRPLPSRISDPRLPLAMLPVVGRSARRKLLALTPRQRVEQVLRLCFHDPAVVPESRLVEAEQENAIRLRQRWAGDAMNRSTADIIRSWLRPGASSLWSVLPKVRVPTLVVWGAGDRVITARKASRTAEALPSARLLMLARTGHVAHMERPAMVARGVLGMWEAHRNGSW